MKLSALLVDFSIKLVYICSQVHSNTLLRVAIINIWLCWSSMLHCVPFFTLHTLAAYDAPNDIAHPSLFYILKSRLTFHRRWHVRLPLRRGFTMADDQNMRVQPPAAPVPLPACSPRRRRRLSRR